LGSDAPHERLAAEERHDGGFELLYYKREAGGRQTNFFAQVRQSTPPKGRLSGAEA
jgi:hypothetical protein